MSPDLVRLKQARDKLSQARQELNDFLASQHSVRTEVIENLPRYKSLQRKIRRAKAVVRSIERSPH